MYVDRELDYAINLRIFQYFQNIKMPITIKDYTWDETETTLHVVVPLKGVKANKVDIFSTDEYLKVSLFAFFRSPVVI